MNDFTHITIGIITSYQACYEGVVTRVTEKQIVVTRGNSTARYDRRSGYAIGRHDSSSLATLDSQRWQRALAARGVHEKLSALIEYTLEA